MINCVSIIREETLGLVLIDFNLHSNLAYKAKHGRIKTYGIGSSVL